jgi:TolA-binding protein/outer membrane protein OmpA-like peptidoglycan-associated protein
MSSQERARPRGRLRLTAGGRGGYDNNESELSTSPRTLLRLLPLLALVFGAGCAYYNTFYNARRYYADGVKFKDQGQQSQAKGKLDKAIEKSAVVIQRWPKSRWVDDALYLIGLSYYQESYYGKAIKQFDQLSLAFPRSPLVADAELYRGLALLADKQYGDARVALDGVKQKYPRMADAAAFYLARSFVEREEQVQAADSLAAFVKRYPKSRFRREALRLVAEQQFELKRYGDAERSFGAYAAATIEPKERARANLRVAAARLEQGRHAEAAQMAQDVIGRYRDFDDEAYLVLGRAQAGAGKSGEALGSWAKIRNGNDYGAEAAFRTGKFYEEHGSFDTARAYFDTARQRRADSDYGVQAVKRLSLLDAFSQQKSADRPPAEALFLLAEVHNLNLGDYDKAMTLYQQVHDSFPTTDWAAKALFAKAWILRNMKSDTAAATPLLRQVIAEYPQTEYADESRRWLGLPVPKRPKKEVNPPAETTQARVDSGKVVLKTPVPAESVAAIEPKLPPRGPGESLPETLDERLDHRPGMPPVPRPMDRGAEPGPPGAKDVVMLDTTVAPRAEGARKAPVTPLPKPTEPARVDTAAAPTIPIVVARFGTDSAMVDTTGIDSLRAVVTRLQQDTNGLVRLVGYCDPRASEQHNRALGLRRAEAVRDWLVAHGIAATRITLRSEGEKGLLSTDPQNYWLDRRVELELR